MLDKMVKGTLGCSGFNMEETQTFRKFIDDSEELLQKAKQEEREEKENIKECLMLMSKEYPNIRLEDIFWTNFIDFEYKEFLRNLKEQLKTNDAREKDGN